MGFAIPKDIKIIYAVSNGFQLLEHCLALYEWLGGEFHVSPNKTETVSWLEKYKYNVKITSIEMLLKITDSPKNIFIVPSGSHGYSGLSKFKNVYYTTHGVSEKNLYLKQKDEVGNKQVFPLQFSRYLRGTYEYSNEYHEKFFKIDKSKQTILYAPTQGTFSSLSNNIVDILREMQSDYNVIIKPHALCWELNKQEIKYISKYFPINIELHNIMPFLELMDVYVGDVSAATSAATYFYEKPIILIKDSSYKATSKILMDNTVVSIVTKNDYSNLSKIIKDDLKNPMEKKNGREQYFNTWYSTIDGTEGFKFAELILKNSKIDYKLEG